MSARDPRDITDVFARELVNDREFIGFPPGTVRLDPEWATFVENDDGTWTWYLSLTFTPRADATDRRPEVDPQPVR